MQQKKSPSLTHLAFRKLRRHRMAMAGLWVLALLYVTCFAFSDFIAPYGYDNERRDLSYQPPSRIHLFDTEGKLRWPFVYRMSYRFDENHERVYTEDKSKRYPIRLFPRSYFNLLYRVGKEGEPAKMRASACFTAPADGEIYVRTEHIYDRALARSWHPAVRIIPAGGKVRQVSVAVDEDWQPTGVTVAAGQEVRLETPDSHRLLGLIPTHVRLFGVDEPARLYLLGADARGRDLLSRIIYGGRVSLTIGLVGVAVSFVIGMLVGGLSGYYGGKFDVATQRVCEMIMLIPSFFLMLALRAALPADLGSIKVYFMIVLIMSFIGWAGMARVIRGMVLSIRSAEYVEAARAIGQSDLKIIVFHVLPQTLSYGIVSVTLAIPGYILGESALSLLGLGIQDPEASWGNLLRDAMSVSHITFQPWILLPGVFIFITVMAFNFLGDGLRDAFDPRSQLVGKEYDEA